MTGVELLAPAGNFETALAAFAAGADAVYCGLSDFSARAFADNFSTDDLCSLLRYAHAKGRRVHVTFNTVIDESALGAAIEQLALLDELHPDALIVQDLGVARICRRHFPGLELHASTQLVAHNLDGVLALRDLGFRRVVLARELSLEEIASIARRCGDVEIECFIHGALCYSLSGLCLFGAMEKGRSGNRGKCPYCCRLAYETPTGWKTFAYSMKDLRLGEDARRLVEVGVASLKIEGRMKSALYVASVTRYYRQILGETSTTALGGNRRLPTAIDGSRQPPITIDDLETVFSRRTTELYLNGRPALNISTPQHLNTSSPIDPVSLGHVGAEIGTVKHVTKDRDGLSWLRFHTTRALEKHDGLQFEAMADGRHLGMGIVEMRQAISRNPVFEVPAGADVEVLLPVGNDENVDWGSLLKPCTKIYCSMSNAVKRRFPNPSFRPSDYPGLMPIDLEVALSPEAITVECGQRLSIVASGEFGPAKNPEKTEAAICKAFSKLGETDYRLGVLKVNDPGGLFVPMSVLNDLRRQLVEQLDVVRTAAREAKVKAALADDGTRPAANGEPKRRVKIRSGQKIPPGEWDEVVIAINPDTDDVGLSSTSSDPDREVRLALPVYTSELDFGRLRLAVKRLLRADYARWEASDLATLRLLRALGVADICADWTLYAFNSRAIMALAELGVKRFVASPENTGDNLRDLAESGFDMEFLVQQSTPLFISLTRPGGVALAAEPSPLRLGDVVSFPRDGLWVTTKPVPRTFSAPPGVSTRLDLSWDVPYDH